MKTKSNQDQTKKKSDKIIETEKILKYIELVGNDLSEQISSTQKAIANLRKNQKDADIAKQMLDYVLFGRSW